jgi:hypothetical protein
MNEQIIKSLIMLKEGKTEIENNTKEYIINRGLAEEKNDLKITEKGLDIINEWINNPYIETVEQLKEYLEEYESDLEFAEEWDELFK